MKGALKLSDLTYTNSMMNEIRELDIIKDPYVFEFLGVPENKPMFESDLEAGSSLALDNG